MEEVKMICPVQIWVCSPVAPPELVPLLEQNCDQVLILQTPSPFGSVSRFYQRFPQVQTEDALREVQQHNQTFLGYLEN